MHLSATDVAQAQVSNVSEVGWFAARQPGIVRFLEERLLVGDPSALLRAGSDAFGVALEAAWGVVNAFGYRDRLPPPRVTRALLERAEAAIENEARHGGKVADGCAERQPELCVWLAELLSNPPIPLDDAEVVRVGLALASVIYALDEMTTGRMIP